MALYRMDESKERRQENKMYRIRNEGCDGWCEITISLTIAELKMFEKIARNLNQCRTEYAPRIEVFVTEEKKIEL